MKRRYLEARYDVTGLSEAETDVLAGEASAMAEASDRGPDAVDHPGVEVELDYTTIEVCRVCGKEIPEGDEICDPCEEQERERLSLDREAQATLDQLDEENEALGGTYEPTQATRSALIAGAATIRRLLEALAEPAVVSLSGADVIGVAPPDARVEVRQYHREYQPEGVSLPRDDLGVYEVVRPLVRPEGCIGYFDDSGLLVHDGDTCPVHEGA